MPSLLDRVEGSNLSGSAVAVEQVIARLEAGENAEAVRRSLGLLAADVVAAIAATALGDVEGPPLIHAPTTRPRLVAAASRSNLAALFPEVDRPSLLALIAGLLLILDDWDAGHNAAQEADDLGERATSAYWHGIAHRREPDPSNASYWFRRVGRSPVFDELADAARPILDTLGDPALGARLLRGGWDPSAFIDLCTRAADGTPEAAVARRIQREEIAILLELSLRHLQH